MTDDSLKLVMRLLEFTDSAFPVGTFSFSNGLETAAELGEVTDAGELEEYARDMLHRTASTDCVAAMCAFRAAMVNDFDAVSEADSRLWLTKLNAEARQMTARMGRKTAELAGSILEDSEEWQGMGARWLADIAAGRVRGTHPVTVAVVFSACGLSARDLFCSLCYGSLNMVLSAALRCVRVSHYDTQRILFRLSAEASQLYDEVCGLTLDDINSFAPQSDILASLHEKGNRRMFMN